MDLNRDIDNDPDEILWYELEPVIQGSKSSFAPTRTLGFLFLLTAGIGGLQSVFALIFSNGSAHLKDLGLSKSIQAIVWMAGPVAGMTVQPYCGIRSDQCRSSWGRRRPFIAWGAFASVVSLLGLASTKRLAVLAVRVCAGSGFSAKAISQEAAVNVATSNITVFFIVALNIALQPLQGGLRALIADMCPHEQQPTANAVAGIVVSASNILSYALGYVDLQRISVLRALGGTSQFDILCVVTSVTLAVSVGLTCLIAEERNAAPGDDGLYTDYTGEKGTRHTVRAQLWYLCTSFSRLPRQVQQVFKVQFFSWLGWFPFLFYVTTYISETYHRIYETNRTDKNDLPAVQGLNKDVQTRAARTGSLGLMLFALVALVAGTLLSAAHKHANQGKHVNALTRAFTRLTRSMRHMWIMSQILFAICMFATAFTSSVNGVYLLVGLCGISWAITIWAPYTLISAQIVQDVEYSGDRMVSKPLMQHEEDLSEDEDEEDPHDHGNGADDACERRSGVVLGLHNVAIAGPQVVAAAACSAIFWMLEGSSKDGVGWTLRAGGLAALVAAMVAVRLQDAVHHEPSLNMVRLSDATRD
ncbi:hypothetical protein PFICI_14230 [Pestalotiopsis fici W106-1]|uniref:Major facilitator superfamily (MFS) profile domain-containing protein n=1 Tax=Pestalotiopsis fici (strain W106-1 / CGMCC3.15140) TaxID=1229662 RepID=W3WKV0_PESFW|nr:uncharacterized protein PFICI_14230 [Pestalotiopsis fici W106-1]ETS74364.1 hypothetical protein PFICI_14230 [Pestalotiopsis fici W106-1]